jgi:circadian clock protein KaiB
MGMKANGGTISGNRLSPGKKNIFKFLLYVTGASLNSSRAITNARNIFENSLPGQYELEIVDVHQQPQIAKHVDIIALPLLVRKKPLPEKRLIGDMSDIQKVKARLEISDSENGNA